jgi:hypothetical protein
MANESIIFLCPACGTKLTVPSQMAGVVGPCPTCRVEIQAPYPVLPEVVGHTSPAAAPETVVEVEQLTVAEIEERHVAEIKEKIAEVEAEPVAEIQEEFVAETGEEKIAEIEPELIAEVEAEPIGGVEPGVVPQIEPPTITAPVEPAVQRAIPEAQQQLFPKTPPPYPLGTGSPVGPKLAVVPVVHPSFAPPRIELPLLDEITEEEAPVSQVVGEEKPPSPALKAPLGPRRLPPAKINSGSPTSEGTARASLPLPGKGSAENVRQISLNRGPTTVYPEARRPLGGSTQNEASDDEVADSSLLDGPVAKAKRTGKRHSHQKRPFVKFLVIGLFLILLGGTVLVLWKLQARQKQESIVKQAASSVAIPAVKPVESVPASKPPISTEQTTAILVKPKVDPPVVEEVKPEPTVQPELSTPARVAMQVLEKFLAASSLAERMPLMETKTPANELEASLLANSLPKTGKIAIEVSESNPAKQVVDYYHHVTFENASTGTAAVTILVRTRGTEAPKVVVDPFLDSYGGRLADFVSKPSDKAATFQVIIWPLAACYDPEVPNRTEKLTFKLLAMDDTKEIALAYFGKQSPIAKMLEDDSHRLSYGKAQVCTVSLGWNATESPNSPYLEVTDVKTLDWDP